MPYTNPWTDNVPLGGDNAGPGALGISAQLRRLKLDIEERMADLVDDWQADPVVLKGSVGSLGFAKFYPGIPAELPDTVKAILILEINATTDVFAQFIVNFALLAEVWPISTDYLGSPMALFWNNTGNDACFVRYVSNTPTTITFQVMDEDGSGQGLDNVQGRLMFLFSATP